MSTNNHWIRSGHPTKIVNLAIVTLVALGSLGLAPPAQAHVQRTWSSSTICVESHVGKEWDVRGAIRRWNRLDGGPKFVLETRCAGYDGTVTVRYENSNNIYTGWSKWYWDESGHIVHADVTVNPQRIKAFASPDRSCQRKHTITHEFGHVLGLRHYRHSHAGSVMSYLGWKRLCGGLTRHDRADFRGLYPAPTA
jgi:hypothetical protein